MIENAGLFSNIVGHFSNALIAVSVCASVCSAVCAVVAVSVMIKNLCTNNKTKIENKHSQKTISTNLLVLSMTRIHRVVWRNATNVYLQLYKSEN